MQICLKCNESNYVKHGVRKNKHGLNQVFLCKNCGSFFSINSPFKNMTYQKEVVIKALEYFCKGFSYDKIANILQKEENFKISKSTIYRWVGKAKNG